MKIPFDNIKNKYLRRLILILYTIFLFPIVFLTLFVLILSVLLFDTIKSFVVEWFSYSFEFALSIKEHLVIQFKQW